MQQRKTKVALNQEARKHIIGGVKAIYDPVRLTLGPEGGNALLYRTYNRGPRITNDGKTIAGVVEPKNEFQAIVASSFREACERTDVEAGDGTTTTTVLAGYLTIETLQELLENSEGFVSAKSKGVISIKNELLAEAKKVVAEIEKQATKITSKEELEKIATVSVESADLGKIIAELVWETGVNGAVHTIEGFTGKIETEIVKGMKFPAKVAGKAFVNNAARSEMVMEDVPVLVTNYNLDNVKETGELIGKLLQETEGKKLAIVAPKFSEEVLVQILATCLKRNQDGSYAKTGYELYPVHAPSLRTEQLQDLSLYVGATFIDKNENKKLQTTSAVDLGFVSKLVVKDTDAREDAVATGGKGEDSEAVKERIKELNERLEQGFKVDSHRKIVENRIASLAAAVGIIRVDAKSDAEARYLKLKIEDAVYATKAALEEGYVKGGGLCLKEIAESIELPRLGKVLERPYKQIMENAEEEIEIGEDVIDPAKVVRLAVENAVSVTSHLITVKAIIPEVDDTTPGEGYESIAKAINVGNRIKAKRDALEFQRIRAEEEAFDAEIDDAFNNDHD